MDEAIRRWTKAMRARRYAEAWAVGDAVIAARDPTTHDDPALPYHRRWLWDGRALDDGDVLVRCYQGLGDTIQFARFLPLLARRAARVTVEASARLHPLLAPLVGEERLIAFDRARPTRWSGPQVEIMELAHALRAAPADASAPYLAVTPAALPRGTVGLCPAAGDWDASRNVPAALLAPLCGARPCLSLLPGPNALSVLNPAGCPFDLAATARLVAGCALVVTVDTMIAHLAGALGVPTWLMLKHAPDWRWSPTARDSDWYPSLRLYHQPASGDWTAVVAAIARDLEEDDDDARPYALGPGVLGRADRQDYDPRDQARAPAA
jgi:hypothetical protein